MGNEAQIQNGGISGSINHETGLEEWTVLCFTPTRSEAKSYGAPVFEGVPLVGREIEEITGKVGYNVTLTYRGIEDEVDTDPLYSFRSNLSREKLENHPRIKTLIERWNGTVREGKVTFPLERPDPGETEIGSAATGFSLASVELTSGLSKEEEETNPLFGEKDFIVYGAEFVETFVRKTVPDSLILDVGKITDRLPGGFPTPPGRNWMFKGPDIQPKGNAYQITRARVLSRPGGHSPYINETLVR